MHWMLLGHSSVLYNLSASRRGSSSYAKPGAHSGLPGKASEWYRCLRAGTSAAGSSSTVASLCESSTGSNVSKPSAAAASREPS